MKYLQTLTLTSALIVTATPVLATEYSDNIHKNDYKWLQFNLMYAYEELPRPEDAKTGHDYLEIEFGGRSGFLDLYGYVDIFNLTNSDDSDKKDASKTFVKLQPRFSLDAITGRDLSFGPVQELYFSTLFNWGGGTTDVNNSFWGLGADVMVPWFGKIGVNLYGLYELNKKAWNGYQVSTNWFKPFVHFENESFIAYQGYIDYQFGAEDEFKGNKQTSSGGAMFNGFYWHSEHWAAGYGFKLYKDIYLIEDSKQLKSTGISHYFAVTYKL